VNIIGLNFSRIYKAKELDRNEFRKHPHIPVHLPSYYIPSMLPAILSAAIRPSDLIWLCQEH